MTVKAPDVILAAYKPGRNCIMDRRTILKSGLLLGAATVVSSRAFAQGAGWTTLFDGKSLEHFSPIGDANWRLEDGLLVADKASKISYQVSKQDYTDFELRAEFWVSDDANSGVFIRCSNPAEVNGKNAYEVNIFDTRPDPKYATGAIVDVASSSQVVKAGGKWSTFEITAKGSTFDVTFNGIKTVSGAIRPGRGEIPQGRDQDDVTTSSLRRCRMG
jgi:hypothetical protein